MGQPAARIGDMHVCPAVTGLVPHVGGPVAGPCAPTVLTGSMPQARITDMCVCVGPPDVIVKGSATVIVSGQPAARIGDNTAHGGVIVVGFPTVLIGDAGGGSVAAAKSLGGYISGFANSLKEVLLGVEPLSSAEIAQARKAVEDARTMLAKAAAKLVIWDDATRAQSRRWFGDDSEETRKMMLERINKQLEKLDSVTDDSFKRASGKGRDAYAYVYANDDSTIYLGEAFWGAPPTGTNSKAGTIAHEVSHFHSQSSTHDHAYGEKDCAQLAEIAPDAAKENADSFEYFVEHVGQDGPSDAPLMLH